MRAPVALFFPKWNHNCNPVKSFRTDFELGNSRFTTRTRAAVSLDYSMRVTQLAFMDYFKQTKCFLKHLVLIRISVCKVLPTD